MRFPAGVRCKEKLLDDAFKHLKKAPPLPSPTKQPQNLYRKLEEQSHFVLKLHESRGVSDALGLTQNKLNREEAEVMLGTMEAKEKQSLAHEFNKGQYVFQ